MRLRRLWRRHPSPPLSSPAKAELLLPDRVILGRERHVDTQGRWRRPVETLWRVMREIWWVLDQRRSKLTKCFKVLRNMVLKFSKLSLLTRKLFRWLTDKFRSSTFTRRIAREFPRELMKELLKELARRFVAKLLNAEFTQRLITEGSEVISRLVE